MPLLFHGTGSSCQAASVAMADGTEVFNDNARRERAFDLVAFVEEVESFVEIEITAGLRDG